jgi:hypothetical protein
MVGSVTYPREQARGLKARALFWLSRCWVGLFLCAFAFAAAAPVRAALGPCSESAIAMTVASAGEVDAELAQASTSSDGGGADDRSDAGSDEGSASSSEVTADGESEHPEPLEIACWHGVSLAGPASAGLRLFHAQREPRSFVPSPRPRPAESV